MSGPTLFDLDSQGQVVTTEKPFTIVPSCMKCGATGTPIEVDDIIPMRGAVLLASYEISKHETEMHPASRPDRTNERTKAP